MSDDILFQPLRFRALTVKNRLMRSNISGRIDNYNGSGTPARVAWEAKFARGGVVGDIELERCVADVRAADLDVADSHLVRCVADSKYSTIRCPAHPRGTRTVRWYQTSPTCSRPSPTRSL